MENQLRKMLKSLVDNSIEANDPQFRMVPSESMQEATELVDTFTEPVGLRRGDIVQWDVPSRYGFVERYTGSFDDEVDLGNMGTFAFLTATSAELVHPQYPRAGRRIVGFSQHQTECISKLRKA